MTVTIKTGEEQDKMRIAGRLAADVLDMIGDYVKPGVSTQELDRICHDFITVFIVTVILDLRDRDH